MKNNSDLASNAEPDMWAYASKTEYLLPAKTPAQRKLLASKFLEIAEDIQSRDKARRHYFDTLIFEQISLQSTA